MSWSVRMRSGGSRSSSSGSLLAYCFTHRKAPWRLMRCGAFFRLWDVRERSSVRWRVARYWNNVQSYRQVPRFSDRGGLPGTEATRSVATTWGSSATMADYLVLKPFLRSRAAATSSATMADYLVLKPMHPKTAHELGRCISKYRKICLVFLFQRAVSAIFSWKVRSPQAWIPALTAV